MRLFVLAARWDEKKDGAYPQLRALFPTNRRSRRGTQRER